jgi:hypothetical protein
MRLFLFSKKIIAVNIQNISSEVKRQTTSNLKYIKIQGGFQSDLHDIYFSIGGQVTQRSI